MRWYERTSSDKQLRRHYGGTEQDAKKASPHNGGTVNVNCTLIYNTTAKNNV